MVGLRRLFRRWISLPCRDLLLNKLLRFPSESHIVFILLLKTRFWLGFNLSSNARR